jgi:hypothetical protein
MIRVSSKNTFIDIAVSDDEVDEQLPRARSAEDVWSRKFGDGLNDLARQSLQRLNAVLTIGISGGAKPPQQSVTKEEDSHKDLHDASSSDESVSELHSLKERLGNALVAKSHQRNTVDGLRSLQERLGKALLLDEQSRMAHDAAPEGGNQPSQTFHPTQMRHAWSSGSISTMASEWSEGDDGDFRWDVQGMQGLEDVDSLLRAQTWSENNEIVSADRPTTVMIHNIPSRYSQSDLMNDLNASGFSGTFDFLYIPIDGNTLGSLGYAFVNFIDPASAAHCMASFQNYPFKRHQRRRPGKVARVSIAHLQGLDMNLRQYENTAVNLPSANRRRPIVMANIAQMFA